MSMPHPRARRRLSFSEAATSTSVESSQKNEVNINPSKPIAGAISMVGRRPFVNSPKKNTAANREDSDADSDYVPETDDDSEEDDVEENEDEEEEIDDAGEGAAGLLQKELPKKGKKSFRHIRRCPYPDCGEMMKRPAEHFHRKHPDANYDDYRAKVTISKINPAVKDIDVVEAGLSPKQAREALEKHNMYNACTRCSLIDEFKKDLINLEFVSNRNAANYSNRISYVIESCCNKETPILNAADVVNGLAINGNTYYANLHKLSNSNVLCSYIGFLQRFLRWLTAKLVLQPNSKDSGIRVSIDALLTSLAHIHKIHSKQSRINKQVKTAQVESESPPTYHECLKFIRDAEVQKKFWDICNAVGGISSQDYKFVLYYTIARVIFSNGARAEVGYKSQNEYIHSYVEDGKEYKLVKVPNAKSGLTIAVMDADDVKYFDAYQQLRSRISLLIEKEDDKKFSFVSFSLKPVGHQISENIQDIMKLAGHKPIKVYDVRRSCTTSAIKRIWDQFREIEDGTVDIGQAVRGHSSKTACNIYDRTKHDKLAMLAYSTLRKVENGEIVVEIVEDAELEEEAVVEAFEESLRKDDDLAEASDSENDDNGFDSDLQQLINKRLKEANFFTFVNGLVETEETWDKSDDFKVVSKGKRTRYYKESWKKVLEKFLARKTAFKHIRLQLADFDELIPDGMYNECLEKQNPVKEKNKVRKLVYSNASICLQNVQTVVLMRFLTPQLFNSNLPEEKMANMLISAAQAVGIEYKVPDIDQIKFLMVIASKKQENVIRLIDVGFNKNDDQLESSADKNETDDYNYFGDDDGDYAKDIAEEYADEYADDYYYNDGDNSEEITVEKTEEKQKDSPVNKHMRWNTDDEIINVRTGQLITNLNIPSVKEKSISELWAMEEKKESIKPIEVKEERVKKHKPKKDIEKREIGEIKMVEKVEEKKLKPMAKECNLKQKLAEIVKERERKLKEKQDKEKASKGIDAASAVSGDYDDVLAKLCKINKKGK